jgi:hypothetical protein
MSADSRLKKIELEVKPKEDIAVFMQELINYPETEPRYFKNTRGGFYPEHEILTEEQVSQFAKTFNGQVITVIYVDNWREQKGHLTD